jgi:hypothetical protein
MRYRANAKVLDQRGKEIGRVTYTVKAKNRAEAKGKISKMAKARRIKRRKNVEGGFYDATGFHPIRALSDYDSSRVKHGREGRKARSKRARKSGALYSSHY